jgi:hypothetical protein
VRPLRFLRPSILSRSGFFRESRPSKIGLGPGWRNSRSTCSILKVSARAALSPRGSGSLRFAFLGPRLAAKLQIANELRGSFSY